MYKIIGGDGQEYGPIPAATVRQWIAEGRANAQTRVWPEGGGAWVPLGQLPEFAASFSAPPSSNLAPTTNPFAVTGFILSLVSITFGLCCCYGLPFNVCGIIFSAIGLVQIRNRPGHYTGRGLAIAGLVVGILSVVLAALMLTLGVVLSWDEIMKDINAR